MKFWLALLPILLILYLMVGRQWGASRAGSAGYLAALLIAALSFGAGPVLLAYAHARALLLALDVLLIVWSAFLLFRVADEAGAIRTIGQALPHLTSDPGMQALLIGWIFASFLQGVGGFGVPVAVIAPIFVGLGFEPLAAVVIPSIGHGWAVTFGSLGSSFQALVATTGLPGTLLAPFAAFFLGCAGLLVGIMVAHAAGGWTTSRRLLLPVLILGTVMGSVQYLTAVTGFWNLGAFTGGLAGLFIGVPLARHYSGQANAGRRLDIEALLVALSGYIALMVIILAVQLLPSLKAVLSHMVIQVDFPEVSTKLGFVVPAGASRKLVVLRHTGVVLFYASVVSYIIYHIAGLYKAGAMGRIVGGTARRVLSSSISIVSMVSMAVVMQTSGMTDALARGLAQGVGGLFPAVAPWIGALGAFMTGSNTNSNVVFSVLQLQTAQLLNYPVVVILAAQTAGAALASVMAPTKVVVGASTAGMANHEGKVMRKLIVYVGGLVLFISVLTMLSVILF